MQIKCMPDASKDIAQTFDLISVAPNLNNVQSGQTVLSVLLGGQRCFVSVQPVTPQVNASTTVYCEDQGKMEKHQELLASNPIQVYFI